MLVRVARPLALAAAALALAAAFAHPAAALDKIRVGKAVPYIFSFAVVEVAQAKGFFTKEGLEVESIGGTRRAVEIVRRAQAAAEGAGPLEIRHREVPAADVT